MTTVTQSAYAALKGWNKSTVTRAKQAGRLVMVSGLVDVEATDARLAGSSGGRDDVAERHARERAQRVGVGGTAEAPSPHNEARANAQARKESAAADLMEIELAQKRGDLYRRDSVDAVFNDLGASIRSRIGNGPDQITPIVAPVTDMDEVHALESEHHRTMLQGMIDDLQRAKNSLRQRDENVG